MSMLSMIGPEQQGWLRCARLHAQVWTYMDRVALVISATEKGVPLSDPLKVCLHQTTPSSPRRTYYVTVNTISWSVEFKCPGAHFLIGIWVNSPSQRLIGVHRAFQSELC